ncbi:MAG TPA: hypothetical protein VGS15_02650 [Candidatus Acidoferrales bacterium]|nr:hypothetical protein [Candidatus Acidoferrales bacterium]
MRPFRRIFALLPLLAVSISGVAAQQQQSQTPSQPSPQISAPPAAEGPLATAARDLARKLDASLGADLKGKLLVDCSPANLSSASSFDFQQGCSAFSAELASEGVTMQPANSQQPAATVHLTLSSNFAGFLWVADVAQASAHKVYFSVAVSPAAAPAPPAAPQLTLQKTFLLSSPDPILDAEILPASSPGTPENLLILLPESIELFGQTNGSWKMQSQDEIETGHPRPRDLRGRLQQGPNGLQAVLPGIACDITLDFGSQPNLTVTASCKAGDVPWAASSVQNGYPTLLAQPSAQTNLFTSSAFPGLQFESLTEFELGSVTSPSNSIVPLNVLATLPDGRALLFEGSATPVASFTGWGSDIAALWSRTRQRWPILVTRDSDWTQPDAIQAFDIVEHQAVPVSAPMDFEGPITALWPEGENEALAVSRNLKTGLYEAYLLRATYAQ